MEQELRFGLNFDQIANFPAFIASKCFESYTSNEMIQFVAHFDVLKIHEIKKKRFRYFIG